MRIRKPAAQLDAIDRVILAVLQDEGRISNQALAARVHLSPSACLRRVKALEDGGVIARYVALLDPKAIGRPGTSYTIVNLEGTQPHKLEAFERAVRDAPEILDCFYVAGTEDYLIRFTYRDAEDLISVCRELIAPNAHELSADGKFSWEEVECLGACANAPMVQIGKDFYEDLTPEKIDAILDGLE